MEAFDELLPEFVEPHLKEIRTASFVCMDANIPSETMLVIAEACEKAGIPLWFEPTSRFKCGKIVTSKALPLLRYISPTISELGDICASLGYAGSGRDTKECSRFLLKLYRKLVIVCHHQNGVDLAFVEDRTFSFLQFPCKLVLFLLFHLSLNPPSPSQLISRWLL